MELANAIDSFLDDLSKTIAILSPLAAVAVGWLVRRSDRTQQKVGDNAERISKIEGLLKRGSQHEGINK